jgi:hypothetical protein
MQDGLKRDYGHGFYGIDRVYRDPNAWENHQYTRDLYYRETKLDSAGFAEVSPSGRYALYERQVDGGWVLFDSRNYGVYRLQNEAMPMPHIEHWTTDESQITVSHYAPQGGKLDTKTIDISGLDRIETIQRKPGE